MQKLREIFSKSHNWSTEARCSGNGWDNLYFTPCNTKILLHCYDIVGRLDFDESKNVIIRYGFTCPICKCFTEIDAHSIPAKVLKKAPRIANPGTRPFDLLTPKQQKVCMEYLTNI